MRFTLASNTTDSAIGLSSRRPSGRTYLNNGCHETTLLEDNSRPRPTSCPSFRVVRARLALSSSAAFPLGEVYRSVSYARATMPSRPTTSSNKHFDPKRHPRRAAAPPHKSSRSLSLHRAGDQLDNGAYIVLELIGTGAFGAVYRAVDRAGRIFAIKVLFPAEPETDPSAPSGDTRAKRRATRRSAWQRYAEEVGLHGMVTDHPGVLTLHRTFIFEGRAYIVLDFVGGGTLLSAITSQGLFWYDDEAITRAFLQLCDAVAHCHHRGIAHRDIKPDNVLVSSCGHRFFLADFGLATTDKHCDQFGAGSKHYKSPECLGTEVVGDTYSTHAADVFALGIVLVNLITGGYPWARAHSSDPNFIAFVHDPNHLQTMLPISPPAAALLARILAPLPSARISLSELRREAAQIHRWGLDDDELVFASEAARNNVVEYARALNLDYKLPPAAPPRRPPPPQPLNLPTTTSSSSTTATTDRDSLPQTPPSSSVGAPPRNRVAHVPALDKPKSRGSSLWRSIRKLGIWSASKSVLEVLPETV
ncbi:kinase-like protein [Peniophora sp. CONT]|nr:kinase-like protein [Peniophora sp. CONT]